MNIWVQGYSRREVNWMLWEVTASVRLRNKFNLIMCLFLNVYRERERERERELCDFTQTKAAWIVIKTLFTVNFIYILIQRLNTKHYRDMTYYVTVHSKCSKIPPSASVHFATGVRRSCVVRLGWSSGFFMRTAASKMRASSSSGVSTFIL